MAKVSKRIIPGKLLGHLELQNLLTPEQDGFHKRCLTDKFTEKDDGSSSR